MKGKYLINTKNWFIAPDGKQYKAAWGDVKIVDDSFLGVKTNRHSTNWYAKIGSEKKHVLIAGCQIFYAIKCEETPDTCDIEDWHSDAANGITKFMVPTKIYIAQ